MTKTIIEVPDDVLDKLRRQLTMHHSTYGQARLIAQMQAGRLRQILGTRETRLPLDWIESIPGVTVTMVSALEMEKLVNRPNASGATKMTKNGSTFRIFINENNSITHCRFTLCHELYHVITGPFEKQIYGDFGFGDEEL